MRARPGLLLLLTSLAACAGAAAAPSQVSVPTSAAWQGYDPLDAPGPAPEVWDAVVTDASRARELPVRVYLPPGPGPSPVLLYSHGLGGSRETAGYLGRHWARRGYVAVFLQHPGSDEAVWKGSPPGVGVMKLASAATLEAFLDRVRDVPAVLDALQAWNAQPGHRLQGRLELARVGMSGHSFGALTTQAVSGQAYPGVGARFVEPRIAAAVVMSPGAPRTGTPEQAFAGVKVPWLLLTGTRDVAPIGGQTVASRLEVFPALPPGQKYQVVLDGAEHLAFTDREARQAAPRDPRHHPAILALTTAFWDATLKGDVRARRWLDGAGPRTVLAPADRWEAR